MIAGSQSGKTSFSAWWLWREIQTIGSGDYLAVAPSFPILNKKMLPEFLKVFNALGMGRWWAANMTYEIYDPKTGKGASRYHDPMYARVMFCSANNADSLESATAKAAWLDEVGMDDFKIGAWQAILRRLSLSQGRVLGGTTLYNLGWLKQQIYDPWANGEDEDIDVIQFRSIDNPTFPIEEYRRAKRTMPDWKFQMFYNGVYAKPAGMIYDSFNFEMCKIPRINIPEHWPVFVGMDFGGVHMAGLFTAQDPETKRFYHFEEYLRGNLSIAQHAEEFKKIIGNRPMKWVGGAAPEDQWRLEFQEAGIPVMEPPIKEVEVGIARVYAFHKNNQIYVFDHLSRYLDEKGSYARKLDDNNQPMEEIEHKNEYHILDAERVLFSDLWERQGMLSAETVKGMSDSIRSRWQPTMPIMVSAESDTGGRWGRGRKF